MEEGEKCPITKIDGHDHPPFILLLSCPTGLSPSQVSVVFDESFDRIPHPDVDLENSISEIWDQRVQKNKTLFNGKKFRLRKTEGENDVTLVYRRLYPESLYGGHTTCDRVDLNQEARICLHLGLTDYRTFVGTNLSHLWERFLLPSDDDCKHCQHTSSPLGNGAIIESSDGKIVVLKRSNNVGEFPGHFVFPGGHPEPSEVGIQSHQYDKELKDSELVDKKVSQEMFDSILREVVEEIGVPKEALCNPVFIGVSRRVINVRPAAFFFIKCTLQSNEIQQLYSSAQDGYESTQLYTVSMNDLESMASKMPGCHQGGYALYELMLKSAKSTE